MVYENQIILSCSTSFQWRFILHLATSQLIWSRTQANRSCDLATELITPIGVSILKTCLHVLLKVRLCIQLYLIYNIILTQISQKLLFHGNGPAVSSMQDRRRTLSLLTHSIYWKHTWKYCAPASFIYTTFLASLTKSLPSALTAFRGWLDDYAMSSSALKSQLGETNIEAGFADSRNWFRFC